MVRITNEQATAGGRVLTSMEQIEDYVGRGRRTIYRWIGEENFPAVKVDNRWESHTELIDAFRKRRIMTMTAPAASPAGQGVQP